MTFNINDQVHHKTRGVGRVERLDRTALGTVTHAHVRINGTLYRVWASDLALFETAPPPAFVPQVVPSAPSAA